ncbi:unnamed protein product [Acanthoscelides obtectus]|uniref:Uncharacterized protein n=1 Tax=Acanthoscelides obtectus TaxID=200917 RepID=A0A9P0MI94_ACAOB|nr:unnamed protein product [Acanthoscelides obtectus]CAK1624196.1 hypothetical protein AOBTE_LOCUS2392 [Acanthoscelides obtectus]
MTQEIIESQELSNTQDRETMTDSIITAEKSVRVKLKVNVHHRRKYVETRGQKQCLYLSNEYLYNILFHFTLQD